MSRTQANAQELRLAQGTLTVDTRDPFEVFRAERKAQAAQEERERKAQTIERGGLYGFDGKGRKIRLGR